MHKAVKTSRENMKLAIIGDYNDTFRPHKATNEAIEHSLKKFYIDVRYEWVSTELIEGNFEQLISSYDGFWIAPGSPYKSMSGTLKLIRHARENNIPTFGTCGGFQHMVIEFARNVLGITDAEHAEYDPYASKLVINPLSCSLAGQKLEIKIPDKFSKTYQLLNRDTITEKYYCNFGLNPAYQNELHNNGFKVVGIDNFNEARILELENHPFFIATLFVPQDNSTKEKPHELVTAFLQVLVDSKVHTPGTRLPN
jgi:CTP synthase (UTP-ammonia lyase)